MAMHASNQTSMHTLHAWVRPLTVKSTAAEPYIHEFWHHANYEIKASLQGRIWWQITVWELKKGCSFRVPAMFNHTLRACSHWYNQRLHAWCKTLDILSVPSGQQWHHDTQWPAVTYFRWLEWQRCTGTAQQQTNHATGVGGWKWFIFSNLVWNIP